MDESITKTEDISEFCETLSGSCCNNVSIGDERIDNFV